MSYDLASLFAGKIAALLGRRYTKGRDFFDIGWYLSRWRDLVPNIPLLRNALRQTGWKGEIPSPDNWKDCIYRTVEKADWDEVYRDAENFLENPSDMSIFTRDAILQILGP